MHFDKCCFVERSINEHIGAEKTMKLSAQKRAELAKTIEANKALSASLTGTKTEFTAEEQATFDGNLAKAKALKAQIVSAEAQEALEAEMNVTTPAVVTPVIETAVTSTVRERVLGDPKRGFKSLGHFAAEVFSAGPGGQQSNALRLLAAAGDPTNQQVVGSDGGFLVPPAFADGIYEGLTKEADSISQLCDVYTIPNGVESMTFNADAEVSRADGSRAGGIQGYWKSELAAMTGSRPTFREVTLQPQELYVFVYATDKLLRNASVLSQYINKKATDEIKFKMNNAIINGTGAGQPKGILNSACRVTVAKETGQAAATIVKSNIQKMWQRLLAKSQQRGYWFYDNSIFEQLSSIVLNVGTGGVPLYMPPGGLSGAPYGTILGRPAMPLEYCPVLGVEGDLIFADLQAYALGIRGGIDAAMSIHLKFDYAQTAFRFIFEVDGQPWLNSAITPFTPSGTTTKTQTLSPFATIAARS